jgi:hypothetical protein
VGFPCSLGNLVDTGVVPIAPWLSHRGEHEIHKSMKFALVFRVAAVRRTGRTEPNPAKKCGDGCDVGHYQITNIRMNALWRFRIDCRRGALKTANAQPDVEVRVSEESSDSQL